jgi:DNA-binding XRE family transcriptional regulator
MPLKTNGAKIRELRERRALTLTEFAQQVGYAMNSVYMIEVGRANGGPKFIRAAARVLGCEIEDITDGLREDPRSEAGFS